MKLKQDNARLKALAFEPRHVFLGMQHGFIIRRICHVFSS